MSFHLHGLTHKSSRKLAAEAAAFDEEFGMFYSSATEALGVTLIDEIKEGSGIELGTYRHAMILHESTV